MPPPSKSSPRHAASSNSNLNIHRESESEREYILDSHTDICTLLKVPHSVAGV